MQGLKFQTHNEYSRSLEPRFLAPNDVCWKSGFTNLGTPYMYQARSNPDSRHSTHVLGPENAFVPALTVRCSPSAPLCRELLIADMRHRTSPRRKKYDAAPQKTDTCVDVKGRGPLSSHQYIELARHAHLRYLSPRWLVCLAPARSL